MYLILGASIVPGFSLSFSTFLSFREKKEKHTYDLLHIQGKHVGGGFTADGEGCGFAAVGDHDHGGTGNSVVI